MEKTEKRIELVEIINHSFYCDTCKKYLGTSEELEDGWYQKIGKFEIKIPIMNKWYQLEKCLCDNCASALVEDIGFALKEIGFNGD